MADDKRKGWATPYGFADFKEPVSYKEACTTMKAVRAMWNKDIETLNECAEELEGDA